MTVITTIKDANGKNKEFTVPARQTYKIDIMIDTLDPVKLEAQNPSGQVVLMNNSYYQEVAGTAARETPRMFYLGEKGKIFMHTS